MTAEYSGTVEQVREAFGDKRYWLARLADSGVDAATLDTMDVDADGTVRVSTTQTLRRDRLPGIATQFIRGDLTMVREESWTAVRDGAATATIKASIPGAPVRVDGTATLASAPQGSTVSYQAEVEVAIPLVGGKVEDFIRSQLVNLLTAEQRFTTVWMSENA